VTTAIYLRISSDREGEEAGVTRQRDDCRALAKRRGWTDIEEYEDNDVYAYSAKKRPAYQRLLADIEAGKVKRIVAYRSDRLYRRLADLVQLTELVKEHRVKIATVASGDVDLTTADGLMLANILGSVAQAESQRMGERIARQRLEEARAGKAHGGGRLFGYRRENGTMVLVPEEAEHIVDAAQKLIAGASLHSVVAAWNAAGIKPAGGGRWSVGKLRRMITGPHLAGLRVHRPSGQTFKGSWSPILTEDQSAVLRAKFPDRSGTGKGKGERLGARRHVLTGFVWCGGCGARMVGSADRYICPKTLNGGCGNRVTKVRLEELIDAEMAQVDIEPNGHAERANLVAEGLLAEMRDLEEQRTTLIGNRRLSVVDRAALLADLRDQLEEKERELARLEMPVKVRKLGIGELLDRAERMARGEATPEEMAKAAEQVRSLIRRITIQPVGKAGWGRNFNPDRVAIEWQPSVVLANLPSRRRSRRAA